MVARSNYYNQNESDVRLFEPNDSGMIDAFGRVRTSSPYVIFDYKQGNVPLFYASASYGNALLDSGSLNRNNLVVSGTGDYYILQQRTRNNYQPGQSSVFTLTGRMPPETNTEKRIGCYTGGTTGPFAASDGLYFSSQSGTFYVNTAYTGSINAVPQSQWNLDPMDGTGPSEIILDKTAGHIFMIDFAWLGFGRARFGFLIGGKIIYVHQFLHANVDHYPYLLTANLPVRYEIRSLGGVGEMDQVCSSYYTEGGSRRLSSKRAASTKADPVPAASAGVVVAVVGVRLKNGTGPAGPLSRTVRLKEFSAIAESNDDFRWIVSLNPIVTGSFAYEDTPQCVCQQASGSGTDRTIAEESLGLILQQGYSKSSANVSLDLEDLVNLGSDLSGTRDELVLSVQPMGNNALIHGSLTWEVLL